MEDLTDDIQEAEFVEQALTLKEKATGLVVLSQETFAAAGDEIKLLKDNAGKIIDFFKPLKEAAHAAHKAITTKEAEVLKPIKEADSIIRGKMNVYLTEQENIRRIAEDKARREAEEVARKERGKLLAQAVKAEEKGNTEKADTLIQKAEYVYVEPVTVAPTVTATKTETSATSMVKELAVEVVDFETFFKAIAASSPAAAKNIFDVKAMALKSWVKANGLTKFDGLSIKETMAARIR